MKEITVRISVDNDKDLSAHGIETALNSHHFLGGGKKYHVTEVPTEPGVVPTEVAASTPANVEVVPKPVENANNRPQNNEIRASGTEEST